MRRRAWIGVVSLSVLGHVAVFWPGPVIRKPDSGGSSLSVTLAMPRLPAGPLSDGESPRPRHDVFKPKGLEERRRKVGEAVKAGREPDHRRSSVAEEGATEPAAITLQPSSAMPPPGEAEASPVGLDAYRFALAREVWRLQRYPRLSLEQGQEGHVELQVDFPDTNGRPASISILASSGSQMLDDAAVAAMHQGVGNLPMPSFRGSVRLSVLFEASGAAPRKARAGTPDQR